MYRSFTQLQVRFLSTFRYEVNDVQVFIGRNSVLKALSPFRYWFLEVKSTFLLHSNSQKVSLVSLCDSFDVLTVLIAFVLFNESNHLPILKGDWLIKCVLWECRTRWRQSGSLENKVCFENLIFSKVLDSVSCFLLHFFRALSLSCVLYNRTEQSQGFFICYIKPHSFFCLLLCSDTILSWKFQVDIL